MIATMEARRVTVMMESVAKRQKQKQKQMTNEAKANIKRAKSSGLTDKGMRKMAYMTLNKKRKKDC